MKYVLRNYSYKLQTNKKGTKKEKAFGSMHENFLFRKTPFDHQNDFLNFGLEGGGICVVCFVFLTKLFQIMSNHQDEN